MKKINFPSKEDYDGNWETTVLCVLKLNAVFSLRKPIAEYSMKLVDLHCLAVYTTVQLAVSSKFFLDKGIPEKAFNECLSSLPLQLLFIVTNVGKVARFHNRGPH